MLNWLYNALGAMLSFFSSITGSYALALLFYALIFKIVFLPFNIKQQKNQIKMAKLTPKIELIKAKYRGRTDQPTLQKQQQEIMELQQKEGYNALSGCLPLLIQLPIIMLLYTVIQNPVSYIAKTTDTVNSYNDAPSAETTVLGEDTLAIYDSIVAEGKEIEKTDIVLALYNKLVDPETEEVVKGTEITLIDKIYSFVDNDNETYKTEAERIAVIESYGIDYESIPNFKLFGVNLAKTPSIKEFSILVLIPVLAAAASWLSMWLTRKLNNTGLNNEQDAQTRASMRMMDIVMPLMTLWIAFSFSGMLGLYWIYQSILGLILSFILSKLMPLPKYTEDDLKEMKRQQKAAEKEQRAAMKAKPRYRSLHYIDDDDYDDLPPAPSGDNGGGSGSTKIGSDIPEIKD